MSTPLRDEFRWLAEASEALGATEGLVAQSAEASDERIPAVLRELAARLGDDLPYRRPRYMAQMQRPPHMVARLAYALALELNANNHAWDGGAATTRLELDAVNQLAAMLGFAAPATGHLCGSGTVANLEALWLARESMSAQRMGVGAIAGSTQAHQVHPRSARLLAVPWHGVAVDEFGRLDVAALERLLSRERVDVVVATLGTTTLGAVDPLDELARLRDRHGFHLHVDAAYGGYHRLAANLAPEVSRALAATGQADSLAIDPHKHGLQPLGCGCVLYRDGDEVTRLRHESPYAHFRSSAPHPGQWTLECSRSGAAAAALWATLRLLPLTPGGEFARGLERARDAASRLRAALADDPRAVVAPGPDLDIVVWGVRTPTCEDSSAAARAQWSAAAERGVHLALVEMPARLVSTCWGDTESRLVTCLRACVMRPEHGDSLDDLLRGL